MSAEQIDLLPCPFCGGEAEAYLVTGSYLLWQCGCRKCGVCTTEVSETSRDTDPARAESIAAWNRRTSPVDTALAEDAARAHDLALELERLKRANDNLHKVNADYRNRLNGQFHASTAAAVLSARDSMPGDQE